jgi:hypothetical protein
LILITGILRMKKMKKQDEAGVYLAKNEVLLVPPKDKH